MKRILLTLAAVLLIFITALSQQISGSITLKPNGEIGKDAIIINYKKSTKTNYGESSQFSALSRTVKGDRQTVRALIEFDLSELPEGATINNAELDLYAWNSNEGFGNHFCNKVNSNACIFQRIITPWEESDVTWKKQPLTTTKNQVVIPMSRHEKTRSYNGIDITMLIQDIVGNSDEGYGIMMKLETEAPLKSMNFCSSDHEDQNRHPQLKITYTLD